MRVDYANFTECFEKRKGYFTLVATSRKLTLTTQSFVLITNYDYEIRMVLIKNMTVLFLET